MKNLIIYFCYLLTFFYETTLTRSTEAKNERKKKLWKFLKTHMFDLKTKRFCFFYCAMLNCYDDRYYFVCLFHDLILKNCRFVCSLPPKKHNFI